MVLLCFTVISALQVSYIYCIHMMEIQLNAVQLNSPPNSLFTNVMLAA